jgi:hypothetical protein
LRQRAVSRARSRIRTWLAIVCGSAVAFASGCRAVSIPAALPIDVDAWIAPGVALRVTEGSDELTVFAPANARTILRVRGAATRLFERAAAADTDTEATASSIEDPRTPPDDDTKAAETDLGAELWAALEEILPIELLEETATRLGISRHEVLRDLCGKDLIVVEVESDDRRAAFFVSRAARELLARLPEAAGLTPWPPLPRLGAWSLHRIDLEGEPCIVALAERTFALATEKDARSLIEALSASTAKRATIEEYPEYVDLTRRLGESWTALFYSRSDEDNERHAVAVTIDGERLEASYAAHTETVAKYTDPIASIDGIDFSPVSRDALAAGSISVIGREIPSESFLDFLVFPSDFRDDVLARIAPPIVFFVDVIPRARLDPDPGIAIPVFGVAVRMLDPAVAPLLERMVGRIHFWISMGSLDVADAFLGIETAETPRGSYRTADFGPVLRAAGEDTTIGRFLARSPAAGALTRVAYGAIGEHWVVCTQTMYFRDWLERFRRERAEPAVPARFDRNELEAPRGLIATVVARGDELSRVFDELEAHVKTFDVPGDEDEESKEDVAKEEAAEDDDEEDDDEDRDSRAGRPIRELIRRVTEKRRFALQLWLADPETFEGRIVSLGTEEDRVGESTGVEPAPRADLPASLRIRSDMNRPKEAE